MAGDGDQIGHEARLRLPNLCEAALSGGALLHAGVHRRASKEVRARGPFGEGDGHCGRQIRPEVPVEA